MTRNLIINPIVKVFSTTIEIPINKPIDLSEKNDINTWQEIFSKMVENTNSINEKIIFKSCQSILKWGCRCGAFLEGIYNENNTYSDRLKFTFSFYRIEQLMEFVQFLKENANL